jgi:hypothetical protein
MPYFGGLRTALKLVKKLQKFLKKAQPAAPHLIKNTASFFGL